MVASRTDKGFVVAGHRTMVEPAEAGLHLVATPIGNLADISLRALQVLAGVDLIACEDTRVSARLLDHYGIDVKRIPYHDHNADKQRPRILRDLAGGARIAVISDAGTPLISDPGYKLAAAAIAAGHRLHVLPGASAPLSALLLSGLPSDRFFFEGFLPPKQAARRARLAQLQLIPGTLLFFESPRRLGAALSDMAAMLGNRQAAVARELTKFYEEVKRGSLDELAAAYAQAAPKGEIVVVVAPPGEETLPAAEDIDGLLDRLMAAGSLKDAAREAARQTGLSRRELYERALQRQNLARDDAEE